MVPEGQPTLSMFTAVRLHPETRSSINYRDHRLKTHPVYGRDPGWTCSPQVIIATAPLALLVGRSRYGSRTPPTAWMWSVSTRRVALLRRAEAVSAPPPNGRWPRDRVPGRRRTRGDRVELAQQSTRRGSGAFDTAAAAARYFFTHELPRTAVCFDLCTPRHRWPTWTTAALGGPCLPTGRQLPVAAASENPRDCRTRLAECVLTPPSSGCSYLRRGSQLSYARRSGSQLVSQGSCAVHPLWPPAGRLRRSAVLLVCWGDP